MVQTVIEDIRRADDIDEEGNYIVRNALKIYTKERQHAFKNELKNNLRKKSGHLTAEMTGFSEFAERNPVIINGYLFESFSYILFDYFSRGTVLSLLLNACNTGTRLWRDSQIHLFKSQLQAIEELHSKSGLIHGDIKLENTVLSYDECDSLGID